MDNREFVFMAQIIKEGILDLLQDNMISMGLVCKITSHILILIDKDPLSEKMYQLMKNAKTTMKEIEYEKDKDGAMQRCLTHLELVFSTIMNHHDCELCKIKNMIFQSFTSGMSWIYSKESQAIYNDIVKIAFYQMVCLQRRKSRFL